MQLNIKPFLDQKVKQYNNPSFIKGDPISIPYLFSKKQDIEIAAFFAAIFALGRRSTTIYKSKELMQMMGNNPYNFVLNHTDEDLKLITHSCFKHRTFNSTDVGYFVTFLKRFYQKYNSLEEAFYLGMGPTDKTVEKGLIAFKELFFDAPKRTKRHVSSPSGKSACKRINMFLRWMVRKDEAGVDLGIWNKINPSQLVCPCDTHVFRVACKLDLIKAKTLNWEIALQLTEELRKLDPHDPAKYDFALFGLGQSGDFDSFSSLM